MTAALLGGALALSACSGGDDDAASDLPTLGATPSATSTSATPTASATATGATGGAADANPITVGSFPKQMTTDQQQVAEAYVAYWKVLGVVFGRARLDPAASDPVMSGRPLKDMQRYVTTLQKKQHHVVGGSRVSATRVRVQGAKGALCGRLDDHSYEVTSTGKQVELAPRRPFFYDVALTKLGGRWKVTKSAQVETC